MNDTNLRETITAFQAVSLVPAIQEPSYEALLKALENRVAYMINHDFNGLIQVLYQLDVPEKELRSMPGSTGGQNAAHIIAVMMIRRELQKIETRKAFKKQDDIPDAERW